MPLSSKGQRPGQFRPAATLTSPPRLSSFLKRQTTRPCLCSAWKCATRILGGGRASLAKYYAVHRPCSLFHYLSFNCLFLAVSLRLPSQCRPSCWPRAPDGLRRENSMASVAWRSLSTLKRGNRLARLSFLRPSLQASIFLPILALTPVARSRPTLAFALAS